MAAVADDLRRWLEGALLGVVVSVDDDLQPHMVRVWVARPGVELDQVELYVLSADTQRFLANVERHPVVAANVVEPSTYRSVLFKGTCEVTAHGVKPAGVEESIAAVDQALEQVGMPLGTGAAMRDHYASRDTFTMLTLRVVDIFDQSPKPGAGERLP